MVNHPTLGMGHGNNGFFRFEREGIVFNCIASDGLGWEHVSVSLNKKRCPTWDEMCIVKNTFWDAEDCVVQFHPPKSEHVNNHPYVLHLWRSKNQLIPTPPSFLVGIK
jgi:hypothetical protein